MDFLGNGKRFSFKLDGTLCWDLPYGVQTTENGSESVFTYTFAGGLKVTNVVKNYEKYGACEWVNYFENTSDTPTGRITELWDCDCTLPIGYEAPRKWETYFPDVNTATKIYAPTGSLWQKNEFYADVDTLSGNARLHHIYPGGTKNYAASGGRSSQAQAPFFNVHKNGEGYIFAIGWTGQWNCQIGRTENEIQFRSKIEDTAFRVLPNEKLRTSSVVVMPYSGDVIDGQNQWRRLVKAHFSLIGMDGRDPFGPLCMSVWGGMTTQLVLERIRVAKENQLPFEYVWMDAGWYGADTHPSPDEFEGDWGMHTGDWRISEHIHPNALRDVAKATRDAGMKFLLWFEPERVRKEVPIVQEHPEYFFADSTGNSGNLLLNLGNEEAWQYCYDMIASLVESLNLAYYRQDFNFDPLDWWRANDAEDRKGISEIKHINGMYRLWDALLEKFPHLQIDNCASGGRRIDIETLRRSIPLWRSDYQCPANYDVEASQCHHQTYNMWMPYSGTGTGRMYDEYRVRSAYDSALNVGYLYSARETACDTPENIAFIKKYTEEYLKIRPYFCEDFYPLTAYNESLDVWCAMQFNRPEKADGVVQVFRRENAAYDTATYPLRGLNADGAYAFADADGGEFIVSGKELLESGLRITLPQKRSAKIYFYRQIEK